MNHFTAGLKQTYIHWQLQLLGSVTEVSCFFKNAF